MWQPAARELYDSCVFLMLRPGVRVLVLVSGGGEGVDVLGLRSVPHTDR